MKLRRIDSNAREMLGHLLTDEEQVVCCTIERPWLGNQHNISCIPAGTYTCKRVFSPHFKCEVFQITNVPHRANVLIHWGSFVTDSEGCVLLGTTFADINGDGTLDQTGSQKAFKKFMTAMTGIDSFTLEVIDPVQAVAA